MSLAVMSMECHEGPITVLGIEMFDRPDHASCSGGHTTPGVMGGWRCICPCHSAPDCTPEPG